MLTGCALQPTASSVSATSADGAGNADFSGKAFGGQQPITGSVVSVYEAGISYNGGAVFKASTTTDSNGNFSFAANAYTCSKPNSPTYIVAIGGNPGGVPAGNPNIALLASLGACSVAQTENVTLNEVTTVATVFALAQFINTTLGSGFVTEIGGGAAGSGTYNRGLVAAMNNTVPALVSIAQGTANTSSTANGLTITLESAKLNTMANILAACINSAGQTSLSETTTNCGMLNSLTNATNDYYRPYNTIQAALMMALYPYHNVGGLFNLSSAAPPFVGLGTAPNDWTLAVSYNTSSFGVGVNGSASSRTSMSLDIDTTQRIWFPSTMSGANGLGYFDPATLTFHGPYGSAYVSHPQYVAIDTNGTAWTADINSNSIVGISTTTLTPTANYSLNVTKAILQNIFLAGNNSVEVPFSGSTTDLQIAQVVIGSKSFSQTADVIAGLGANVTGGFSDRATENYYAASGSGTPCYLITSTNGDSGTYRYTTTSSPCYSGGMTQNSYNNNTTAVMTTSDNNVCYYSLFLTSKCVTPSATLNAPQGIATDGADNLWIANSGNGSISTMGGANLSFANVSPIAYIHDANNGGTLSNPYALGIDGAGNVWTISPGCVTTGTTNCTPTGMVLTELIGAAAPTYTPLNAAQYTSTNFGTKPPN
jgi:hypothetical protein